MSKIHEDMEAKAEQRARIVGPSYEYQYWHRYLQPTAMCVLTNIAM